MAHNQFPFRHDPHPDLTRAIHEVVKGAFGHGKYPRPGASGDVRAGENTPPRPAKPKHKYPGGVVHTRYATEGVVNESHTRAQLEGAEQLDEAIVPVGALMLLPTWLKQAIVIAVVGGTALSYVLDQLHGLRLTMLNKETREHALAVEKWAKEKAKRDGIKAAKAALLKGNKNNKGKKPQSKGAKPEGTDSQSSSAAGASAHKPGTVWKTSSGSWGAKNANGDYEYFDDQAAAERYARRKA